MIVGAIIFLFILAYLFITAYKDEKDVDNNIKSEVQKQPKETKQPFSLKTLVKSEKFLFYAPIIFMLLIYICVI